MKAFRRMKTVLLTCLATLTVAFGGLAFGGLTVQDQASAETSGKIESHQFQTDGASVRVFTKDEGGNLVALPAKAEGVKDQKGIRFHVEMGVGYVYDGTTILTETTEINEKTGNEEIVYKLAEGFKTYTLVLPTRLLSGDLSVNTDKVLKLDTSEYWTKDNEGNLESVGYIWNIPETRYTDNFSFRGVLCTVAGDGTETVVAATETSERSIAYVAKTAYNATIPEDSNYWGSEELDGKATPLLKQFVPTYSITYKVGATPTTEEVLWGDAPQNVPTEGVKDAWYCTESSEEIDVTQVMEYAEDRTFVLETTSSKTFVLTGVAAQANYNGMSGVKIYATLHSGQFSDGLELDIDAVNVEYQGTGTFGGIQSVWAMEDGEQMRLFFEFDSSKMNSGDKIIIKGDSIFYANGVMYKLTEDYTIDYDGVDYGMFLGYLKNSDIKSINNAPQDHDGNGKYETNTTDYFNIRLEFYNDILITGECTFTHENAEEKNPIYIKCGADENKITSISKGNYHWNDGTYKVLDLANEENNAYGWHGSDELFIKAGTIILQNGGYYIMQDDVKAQFVKTTPGETEENGSVLGYWTVGKELAAYGVSEFEATASKVDENGTKEVRLNTLHHWFPDQNQVSVLTIEHMTDPKTEPYAVYYKKAGSTTKNAITEFVYHGQETYQILGIRGYNGETAGDTITIVGGTRFWLGSSYYTIAETINLYFNGSYWVKNFDQNSFGELNAASFNGITYHNGDTQIRMHFTAPLAGLTTTNETSNDWFIGQGSVAVNGIKYTSLQYYYWDANIVFFIIDQGAASVSPVGIDLFHDTLVIEEGTTLWSGTTAYKFTERLEWRYIGYYKDDDENGEIDSTEKRYWILVNNNNVNVANNNISELNNDGSHGGEVRLWLNGNGKVLNTDYYGEMCIDTRTPALYNGNVVTKGFYYNQGNNMVSLVYAQGTNDGDYFIIPEGSVWWTPNNGTVTFTETIEYTFVDGAWKSGDYRATANVAADNATVSGLEYIAKDKTYTFTVTPNSDYVVSAVKVNGVAQTLNANNQYTLTAQAENEIIVETVKGYKVTFVVHAGISVNNGAITNGTVQGVKNGESLTFTVAATGDYKVGTVIGATANGDGTYTVKPTADTTVSITALAPYNVTFSIGEGATVNSGAITDGTIKAVASGDSLTFTVAANEGYKIVSVSNATGSNGSYTVTPTANTTVTITTEKLYKVTYSASEGANITATVANGAWVDNGTTVTFTVTANSGYVLTAVSGATKVSGNTYTATVSGADISVSTTTIATSSMTTANDKLGVFYVNNTGENDVNRFRITYDGQPLVAEQTIQGYWNDNGATYAVNNNGLDIMEYILIDGVSARELVNKSASGETTYEKGTTYPLSQDNGIFRPITVETCNSVNAGLTLKVLKSYKNSFTLTLKAGFMLKTESETLYLSEDIEFSLVLYKVTWDNPTNATVSVTVDDLPISSGESVVKGTSITVTATASTGYRLNTVTIGGASQNGVNTSHAGSSTFNYTVNAATSISATTVKMYTVTASVSGGVAVDATSKTVEQGNSVTFNLTVPSGATIKANGTEISGTSYTVSNVTADTPVEFTTWYTVTATTLSNTTAILSGGSLSAEQTMTVNEGILVQAGVGNYTLKLEPNNNRYNLSTVKITGINNPDTSGSYTITVNQNITIEAESSSCLVEGTMIMLADGTQKAVENIVAGDKVMVFNHETGKYEVGTIWFNDHADDPAIFRNIINLEFANGATARIAYEHGYFDLDLMRYVFIREDNMHEFIGHKFVASSFNGVEVVQSETTLVRAYVTQECVKVYGPITEYHFNLISDEMLSMPSFNFGATGMVNIFDYNEDLSYNEEKMQADIQTYGLFTYEEFSEYMSYEDYCKAPIQYFKVAIGKGNLTWEQIELTLQYLAENEFAGE